MKLKPKETVLQKLPTKPKKISTALTPEVALERAKAAHEGKGYTWDRFVYTRAKDKVEIGCPTHGYFSSTYDSVRRGVGCRHCGYTTARENSKFTTEIFVNKVKDKILDLNGNPMDYSLVDYKDRSTKVTIICNIHGPYRSRPSGSLQGTSGCPICGTEKAHAKFRKSVEQLKIDIAKHLDPTKYWLGDHSGYVGNKSYITMICGEHGPWRTKPGWLLSKKYSCPKCNDKGVSKMELEVLSYVKSIYSGKIESNVKKVISKELDIYLPEIGVAIEFDGLYWHSEKAGKSKTFHLEKTLECQDKGITLIHVYEDEWTLRNELVKNKLRELILNTWDEDLKKEILQITSLTFNESDNFIDTFNLKGSAISQKSSMAILEDSHIVAAMTVSISNHTLEIERFSYTKSSRKAFDLLLHTYLKNNSMITTVIAYSDRRWADHNIYGYFMDHAGEEAISYDYADNQGLRYGSAFFIDHEKRMKEGLLTTWDPTLSEKENCANNGYWRVWNCGMDKWSIDASKLR